MHSLRAPFTSLALVAAICFLSSCDNGSSSSSNETPAPSDSAAAPVAGSVKAPVFSPAAGTYTLPQNVSVSSATPGTTIHVTTDGTTPTTASATFTGPITVGSTRTLKAIAVKSGMTASTVASATYTISGDSGSITYGSLTHADQTYKTVTIGTQTWMAENLNYKVDSSWCYANSADSCAKYGRLYQWTAVMGLDASYSTKEWKGALPHQGICPSGWHVPSDGEWGTLEAYVGGATTAGAKLKSTSGWNISGNSTDAYGFRAFPAGQRAYDGRYQYVGSSVKFWSSSEDGGGTVWLLLLENYPYSTRSRGGKVSAGSVRCIKD